MGRLVVGLVVAVVAGVAASRGLAGLGYDPGRTLPVSLAVAAVAAWPWIRAWWGGGLAGWAARWIAAAVVVMALTHWGCPALR